MPSTRTWSVHVNKPKFLLLSLAVTIALAACARGAPPAEGAADGSAAPATLAIDESKLPPVNRLALDQIDDSKDACSDFSGYVNGKWLAANPIPGDRTSWGAFEML